MFIFIIKKLKYFYILKNINKIKIFLYIKKYKQN